MFVPVLGMAAKGAAVATFISNVTACVYLLQVLLRKRDTVVTLNPAKFQFVPRIAKQVILVGIPAAAIIVLGSSANMMLTHLMSDYGDISIAAYGIVQKIGTIGIQITVGLTQGIMPLLGFCYGAGDRKHLEEINRFSFLLLGVYAALCILVVEVFTRPVVMLFIEETATVEKAIGFLRIWFLCAPGMCFTNLFSSVFQAMGKWVQALLLSVIRQAGFLFPLMVILDAVAGEQGLICAQPLADTITLLIGIVFYVVLIRQYRKTNV